MILVLLGTQNNSFHRLLNELQKCIDNKIVEDRIVVQKGYTNFASEDMELLDFISIEEFNLLVQQADLIITHGGVGSIVTSIKFGKKVIAVPRLQIFNEHVNDHQVQIINLFAEHGYIKGIIDINQLAETLTNIKEFIPIPYISNNKNMLKIISEYIDKN